MALLDESQGELDGGHALHCLLGGGHRGEGLVGPFAAADPHPVDLVAPGQPGDLQVARARQPEGGPRVGPLGVEEQPQFRQGPGEGGGLEVVEGLVTQLAHPVRDSEGDGVDVLEGRA